MSSLATLDAAAAARKSRLSQLKSLKRKQLADDDDNTSGAPSQPSPDERARTASPEKDVSQHISGRNYDVVERAPKMGFVSLPSAGQETVEDTAARIAEETRLQAEKEAANDKPIDLFNLQPKKPNWDLKRDVEKKLEPLNVRTDIAIAKLVRARLEEVKSAGGGGDELEKNLAKMVEEREEEGRGEEKAAAEAEAMEDGE